MRAIINLATTITMILSLKYGLPKLYYIVKVEALKKVQQGLPDLSPMTETLTGLKQEDLFK